MFIEIIAFALLAGLLATYLAQRLGLSGDVLCWMSQRRGGFGCGSPSPRPNRAAARARQVVTAIYMISVSGCSHCARAMPEFTKLQKWCAERPVLRGYEAFVLRPDEISRAVKDATKARQLLSDGVPLYLVVNRVAEGKPPRLDVYKGRRTASDVLNFARSKRSAFLSSSH